MPLMEKSKNEASVRSILFYVGHYVITVVADVLAPIWRQDISNHHADSTMNT